MIDFTVAICTYNGEHRLAQVLDRLKAQVNVEAIAWEVLVVDNNSTDKTAEIVQAYQMNWRHDGSLVYCHESKQGLACARQRAIASARGKFVGFLDDDNLPDLDWVAQACKFGQMHPQAGAYGGKIQGSFEVKPPQNFQNIALFLAIVDRGNQAFIYDKKRGILPPGAGLVVRRESWRNHVPEQLLLKGRIRNSMLASEDLEAVCHIQNAGWEIWYNPAMKMQHCIPKSRLERNYLVALIGGIGLARYHIRMMRLPLWQRPLATLLYGANDLRKIVRHLIQHGRSNHDDLAIACEWAMLSSSVLSPLYLLQHLLQHFLLRSWLQDRRPQKRSQQETQQEMDGGAELSNPSAKVWGKLRSAG